MGLFETVRQMGRDDSFAKRKKFVKDTSGKTLVKEHQRKPRRKRQLSSEIEEEAK